jgi:hypothetical protein
MQKLILIFYCITQTLSENYIFDLDGTGLKPYMTVYLLDKFVYKNLGPDQSTEISINTTSVDDVELKAFKEVPSFFIPRLSVSDSTGNPLNYTLNIKQNDKCFLFDYLDSSQANADSVQCEYHNGGLDYTRTMEAGVPPLDDIQKNLQIGVNNIRFTSYNTIFVTQMTDINKHTFTNLNDYIKDSDLGIEFINNIFQHKNGDEVYIIIDSKQHIFIYKVEGYQTFNIKFLQWDKIDKLKSNILNIPGKDIVQISINGTKVYLYLRDRLVGQNGLWVLTRQSLGTYTALQYKDVNYNGQKINLDITDAYIYNRDTSFIAYFVIPYRGLMICDLNQFTVLYLFTHPYLLKVDAIETPESIYLGLFTDNMRVNEFFIEVAIDRTNFSKLYLNKVYLTKSPALEITTDFNNGIAYFTLPGRILVIQRNQIPQNMIPLYELEPGFTGDIAHIHAISSNVTKRSIIWFTDNFNQNTLISLSTELLPKYECVFSNPGDYKASVSTYLRTDKYYLDTTVYKVHVTKGYSWFFIGALAAGGALLLIVIVAVIIYCVKKRSNAAGVQNGENYNKI